MNYSFIPLGQQIKTTISIEGTESSEILPYLLGTHSLTFYKLSESAEDIRLLLFPKNISLPQAFRLKLFDMLSSLQDCCSPAPNSPTPKHVFAKLALHISASDACNQSF